MEIKNLLASEFENISKESAFIAKIIKRKGEQPIDEISLRAASLSLTAIYNGIEKILVKLLLSRGIKIKASLSWHTDVLRLSREEKIISEGIQKELAGFLSFRHFIRHAYSFEIEPSAIETVLKKTAEIVEDFSREIDAVLSSKAKE